MSSLYEFFRLNHSLASMELINIHLSIACTDMFNVVINKDISREN